MKIGVDAVLLGAWADTAGKRILDVGTGCGVIALMCAQRNPEAQIFAIDIDNDSIIEANANFDLSPWNDRLKAVFEDFTNLSAEIPDSDYDLIISNPPYFNSGVADPDTPRLVARHQGVLSPKTLLQHAGPLLSPDGRLAMIVPADQAHDLINDARSHGLYLRRACNVRDYPDAPYKRTMLEFETEVKGHKEGNELTMFNAPFGEPTDQYHKLCKDFYLKF